MTRRGTILRIDGGLRHVDAVSRRLADHFLAEPPAHASIHRDLADGAPATGAARIAETGGDPAARTAAPRALRPPDFSPLAAGAATVIDGAAAA